MNGYSNVTDDIINLKWPLKKAHKIANTPMSQNTKIVSIELVLLMFRPFYELHDRLSSGLKLMFIKHMSKLSVVFSFTMAVLGYK